MSKLPQDHHGNISGTASLQQFPGSANLLRNRKDKDSGIRLAAQPSGITLFVDNQTQSQVQLQSQVRLQPTLDDEDADKNAAHDDDDDVENKVSS